MLRGWRSTIGALIGAGGLALVALSATGSFASGAPSSAARAPDCHKNAPPILHDGFPEPPTRYSRNGVLDTRLRASLGPVLINHQRVIAMNYEGSYPGPTLVICAGDKLKVQLQNDISEPTNLHVHGFHVSPSANHDNIFLRIEPGQSFNYEYDIPHDMSPGTYWYHPHVHMHVENEIFDGLAGAIVQEGGLDTLPALRKVPQRWIVLQDTEIQNGQVVPVLKSTEAGSPWYVNGVIDPTAKIRPGQLQRWRIFNISSDRFAVVRAPEHQRFELLAEDGNTLARPRSLSELMIAPGSRREVLVRGGRAGTYKVKAAPFAQFPGGEKVSSGGPVPNQTLITLRSAGRPAAMSFPPHTQLGKPLDLRRKHIDRKRTIVFSTMEEPNGNTNFLLNGMTFDPNRTDVTMKLGSVEQWTLVNTTSEWHTFHIHINDFQVVSVNGKRVPFVDYEDNVPLPPKSRTVMLTQPTDFTGKFVFHCHVTFHEDHGMMATVQVVREPTAAQMRRSLVRDGGLAISSAAYGSRSAPPAVRALVFFCRSFPALARALGSSLSTTS